MIEIVLVDAGAKKIMIIKILCEMLGLSLKDAKNMVDNVPSIIMASATVEQTAEIKVRLEREGAVVQVNKV